MLQAKKCDKAKSCEKCGAPLDRKTDDELRMSALDQLLKILVYMGAGAVVGFMAGLGI